MKNIKKVLWFALFVIPFTNSMQPEPKKDADYYLQVLHYSGKNFLLQLAKGSKPICEKDLQKVRGVLLIGVDVNCTDKLQNSALILATIHNQPELVSLLLEHKANKKYKALFNRTALSLAQEFDNKEIAKLLE